MPCTRACRFASRLIPLYALVIVAGCGDAHPVITEVSGTIKIRGKAPNLTGMEIAFLSPDGRLHTAPVGADGIYKASVPAGGLQVGFQYSPYVEPGSGRRGKGGPPLPGKDSVPKGTGKPVLLNPIPEAMRDPSTSKLSFKAEAGKTNVFDYDLKP